jgi:membrane protein implicated in regulation of membrane protease activity
MNLVATWLVLAIIAATVEIVSPLFGFIFISGAAVIAAVAAAIGANVPLQIVVFVTALFLGLLLVRPRLVSKLGAKGVPSRTAALVGQQGQVTEAINPILGTGRVTVAGEDWAARSGLPIPVGMIVRIDGADGIVLRVSQVDSTPEVPSP